MATKLQDVINKLPQDRQDKIHKESDLLLDQFLEEEGILQECKNCAIASVLDFIKTMDQSEQDAIKDYVQYLESEIK